MVKGLSKGDWNSLKNRVISTTSTKQNMLMCFKGTEKEELNRILPRDVKCPSCHNLMRFQYAGRDWEFVCISFLCKKYGDPFSFKKYLKSLKSKKPIKRKRRPRTPVSITRYDFPLDEKRFD